MVADEKHSINRLLGSELLLHHFNDFRAFVVQVFCLPRVGFQIIELTRRRVVTYTSVDNVAVLPPHKGRRRRPGESVLPDPRSPETAFALAV